MIIIVPQSGMSARVCREYIYNITLPRNVTEKSTITANYLMYMHVKDVVTDCSYALAGFLVPTLFGVSPGQS